MRAGKSNKMEVVSLKPANESNQHRQHLAIVWCRVEPRRDFALLEIVGRTKLMLAPEKKCKADFTLCHIAWYL